MPKDVTFEPKGGFLFSRIKVGVEFLAVLISRVFTREMEITPDRSANIIIAYGRRDVYSSPLDQVISPGRRTERNPGLNSIMQALQSVLVQR